MIETFKDLLAKVAVEVAGYITERYKKMEKEEMQGWHVHVRYTV